MCSNHTPLLTSLDPDDPYSSSPGLLLLFAPFFLEGNRVQLGPQRRGQWFPPQKWLSGPRESDGYLLIVKSESLSYLNFYMYLLCVTILHVLTHPEVRGQITGDSLQHLILGAQ